MPVLDPRTVVYRRFSLPRLVTGAAAVCIGIGIQLVVWGPGHLDTSGGVAAVAGLLGAGIGLTLVIRPVADHCARCRRRLEPSGFRLSPESVGKATAALKAGDVAYALRTAGPPVSSGTWVTVWFCPECRSTIVWKVGGERVLATGGESIVAALAGRR